MSLIIYFLGGIAIGFPLGVIGTIYSMATYHRWQTRRIPEMTINGRDIRSAHDKAMLEVDEMISQVDDMNVRINRAENELAHLKSKRKSP